MLGVGCSSVHSAGPIQISPAKQNFLCARRDGQHLAALVKAARRADPVRNGRLAALRAFAQLRQFQHAVVSAALTLPAR